MAELKEMDGMKMFEVFYSVSVISRLVIVTSLEDNFKQSKHDFYTHKNLSVRRETSIIEIRKRSNCLK